MKKLLLLVLIPLLGIITSCSKDDDVEVKITSTLNSKALSLEIDGTNQLVVTITPKDSKVTATWASDKPEIATVSNTGLVKAIAEGTANISVIVGKDKHTCVVTVNKKAEIKAESITLDIKDASLIIGGTKQLKATILPSTFVGKATWTSSKTAVATVKDGLVTAISAGETTITATVGDKNAECKITVGSNLVKATSISLDKNTANLNLSEKLTLVATVLPANTTETTTWTSSDVTIATVENGVITAVKVGSTTITAKVGNFEATCDVTVSSGEVSATSISLDKTIANVVLNKTLTLVATVLPANTTEATTWTSSDVTIATVENGVVTAVKVGSATITAKVGNFEATCDVTVLEPAPVSNDLEQVFSGTLTAERSNSGWNGSFRTVDGVVVSFVEKIEDGVYAFNIKGIDAWMAASWFPTNKGLELLDVKFIFNVKDPKNPTYTLKQVDETRPISVKVTKEDNSIYDISLFDIENCPMTIDYTNKIAEFKYNQYETGGKKVYSVLRLTWK